MTTLDFQQHLHDVFCAMTFIEPDNDEQITVPDALLDERTGIDFVSTYEDAGVMTREPGVVVRMRDGREFQLTVVQSK